MSPEEQEFKKHFDRFFGPYLSRIEELERIVQDLQDIQVLYERERLQYKQRILLLEKTLREHHIPVPA